MPVLAGMGPGDPYAMRLAISGLRVPDEIMGLIPRSTKEFVACIAAAADPEACGALYDLYCDIHDDPEAGAEGDRGHRSRCLSPGVFRPRHRALAPPLSKVVEREIE